MLEPPSPVFSQTYRHQFHTEDCRYRMSGVVTEPEKLLIIHLWDPKMWQCTHFRQRPVDLGCWYGAGATVSISSVCMCVCSYAWRWRWAFEGQRSTSGVSFQVLATLWQAVSLAWNIPCWPASLRSAYLYPQCWHYEMPRLAFSIVWVLKNEPRILCLYGKHFTD